VATKELRVKVIFVELMCTDQQLIRSNIMRKVHAQFGEVSSWSPPQLAAPRAKQVSQRRG
jgi:hypothetical protein